ncbi:MAG TPA: MFS transporter [Ktedonobacteraceae bacterium]|nr:MFS transporter [Ktedonobacteraceae bacterium]
MSISEKKPTNDSSTRSVVPLWRNRDYLLLWSGQAISSVGRNASELAFPLLILALTHSPVQAGLLGAFESAAIFLTNLPAGVLVDRWDRKRTMILCDAGRAIALGSIPIALMFGHLTIIQLYLVALLEGVFSTFFNIAQTSCIPHVVAREQISAAVAQNEATDGVVTLLGPSLGGALYGLARTLPFLVDAVSYIVSVISLLFVRVAFQEKQDAAPGKLHIEIATGLVWLWRNTLIRSIALLTGSLIFAYSGMSLIIILLAEQQHASSLTIGVIFALGGIGGIVGAVLGARLERRFRFHRIVAGVCWIFVALWPLYALAPAPLMLGLILAGIWLVDEIYDVSQISYRLAHTPDELRGRITSAYRVIVYSTLISGKVLSGFLLQQLGTTWTILLFWACFLVIAIVVTLVTLRSGSK